MDEQAHFTTQDRKTLADLSITQGQLITKMDRAIQDIQNLANNFVNMTEHAALIKRVEQLESNNRQIVFTILGIILSGVAMFFFKQ